MPRTYTNQQAFDAAVKHLRNQGRRSFDEKARTGPTSGNGCLYRGPDGRRCAVGALIPNAIYHKDMEGRTARDLLVIYPEVAVRFLDDDAVWLLAELQAVHDDPGSWRTYHGAGFSPYGESQLKSVAARLNLTYTPPEEAP